MAANVLANTMAIAFEHEAPDPLPRINSEDSESDLYQRESASSINLKTIGHALATFRCHVGFRTTPQRAEKQTFVSVGVASSRTV